MFEKLFHLKHVKHMIGNAPNREHCFIDVDLHTGSIASLISIFKEGALLHWCLSSNREHCFIDIYLQRGSISSLISIFKEGALLHWYLSSKREHCFIDIYLQRGNIASLISIFKQVALLRWYLSSIKTIEDSAYKTLWSFFLCTWFSIRVRWVIEKGS